MMSDTLPKDPVCADCKAPQAPGNRLTMGLCNSCYTRLRAKRQLESGMVCTQCGTPPTVGRPLSKVAHRSKYYCHKCRYRLSNVDIAAVAYARKGLESYLAAREARLARAARLEKIRGGA